MQTPNFLIYLLVCASVTYLIRMLPIILVKKKIQNKFIRSFLYYVPYSVLAVMTVPAVFYSTSYFISALVGFAVAVILSYFEKSLLVVSASACASALVVEIIISMVK